MVYNIYFSFRRWYIKTFFKDRLQTINKEIALLDKLLQAEKRIYVKNQIKRKLNDLITEYNNIYTC